LLGGRAIDTYSSITNPVDRDEVNDMLLTKKHLTEAYNTFSNETSTKALQQDLLTILSEEHEMEFKLFQELQKRGWYTVEYANQSEIDKVKQTFSKMS